MSSTLFDLVASTGFAYGMSIVTIYSCAKVLDLLQIERFREELPVVEPTAVTTTTTTCTEESTGESAASAATIQTSTKEKSFQLSSVNPHSSTNKQITLSVALLILTNMLYPPLFFGLWYAFCSTTESWHISSISSLLIGFLQLPFLMFITDCLYYPYHFAVHYFQALRPIHQLHHELHECEHAMWSFYAHPIDFFMGSLVTVFPCYLSANGYVAVTYMAIEGIIGLLNHHGAKVKLPFIAFEAQFHDDHHRFFHCNYALNFKLFDKVFKTYRDVTPQQ